MTFLRLLRMYLRHNWAVRPAVKQAWKVSHNK